MAIVFLIGGTGNQLFTYSSSEENDKMSTFFLSPMVRKLLRWTNHEQILTFEKPNVVHHSVALLCLLCDSALSVIFKISLFTEFDTRSIKKFPLLYRVASVGYFQQSARRRDLGEIANQFKTSPEPGLTVVHVRGGDLLKIRDTQSDVYGQLTSKFYCAAIDSIPQEHRQRLTVVTDDVPYAKSIFEGQSIELNIISLDLQSTIGVSLAADYFISSNSTLSYWIACMREEMETIAPLPFQKRHDFDFPENVSRLKADWDHA